MARRAFPADRTVYVPSGGLLRAARPLAEVAVYLDEDPDGPPTATTLADVRRIDGTSGTILVDVTGTQVAEWLGPDGEGGADGPDSLVVRVDGGPPWRVYARVDDRLDALSARIDDIEIGGGGVPSTRLVASGTGLTGGGDLSADRTLAVAYGTTSTTAARGDDARLSDARPPTAHASTHASAGSDPVTPAAIGAATSGHAHTGTYQPLDSDLTAIAGLTPTDGDVVQRTAGAWSNRTPAQLKTSLSLAKGDVGLGNVDNTSDAAKPISTATQTALDGKAAASHGHAEADITGLVSDLAGKADAGHTHTGTYQPVDTDLTTIAGLTPAGGAVIQESGGAWAARTPTQLAATLPADQAAATASLRTLGTGATQAAAGNDTRLADARTPTAHAASHAAAGGDPVTPGAIGALPATGGTLSGNLTVQDAPTAPTKAYRLRVSGGALDLEAGGAELVISNWSGADFAGTQRPYLVMEAGSQVLQLIRQVQFRADPNGVERHRIDGSTGGGVVINEDGTETDVRIEGGTDPNLLFVDGSADMVGIGTDAPAVKLDVNADSIRVRTARTPASATDTGVAGQIAWDANFLYVAVATNTWKRVALASW